MTKTLERTKHRPRATPIAAAIMGIAAVACSGPFNTDSTCTEQGKTSDCSALNPDSGPHTGGAPSTGGGGSGGTSGTDAGTGGTDGGSGTGGAADGGRDADGAPPCDETASPAVAACVIDEKYGIFVSPRGSDLTGDGSRTTPYKSLSQALSAVTATKRRIYACANGGNYAETIAMGASLDGISLYGAFDCNGFAYNGALSAHLAAPTATAWTVTGLTKGLTVENFDIKAADADTASPGASSIAMIVANSKGVTLRNVTVTAGKGADGKSGMDGAKGADGAIAGAQQAGQAAICTGPPPQLLGGFWNSASACGSKGGVGGIATPDGDGLPGQAGSPTTNVATPVKGMGGPGTSTVGDPGSDGMIGSNGNDGALGTQAALGVFSASGFAPADGGDGTDGFPGQGGGGGGASKGSLSCVGASGGAGGMGGCGGTHGTGGGGGGASVALLVWQSDVTLGAVTLASASGGKGGDGGKAGGSGNGQDGASGGNGDSTNGIGAGGRGGRGGGGGRGGSGSGGSGGPSYALVYKDTRPTAPSATLTPGQGGGQGTGGSVLGTSGTNKAPDGSPGESATEHQVM